MKARVILATICFFWVMSHTSSIRAEETEETWKKVEVGPDKGSYKGKLWGLDAFARFENDQKFVKFTVNQQYSSVKAAVETCKRVGGLAESAISEYGSFDSVREINQHAVIDIDILSGIVEISQQINRQMIFTTPCNISMTNKDNPKIRTDLSVEDKSTTFRMRLTLPIKTQ